MEGNNTGGNGSPLDNGSNNRQEKQGLGKLFRNMEHTNVDLPNILNICNK